MHILMISDVYYPRVNGVSTSIKTFRQHLAMLGVETTLIAPHYDGSDKLVFDIEQKIVRVPSGRVFLDPEDRLLRKKYLGEIQALLNNKKFDLIHIQTPFVAHYLGMKLHKMLAVPVIETYHTFFEEYFYHYIPFVPKIFLRFVARWFSVRQCNQLDSLVVPSTAMLEKLREYGIKTRMVIIPTGIDIPDREKKYVRQFKIKNMIPLDKQILLHVGRVAHEKNIQFLLHMYKRVLEKNPNVILLIAGEGPARDKLRKMAAELGIAAGTYFTRYLSRDDELLDCYNSADVFVFSSRTETQGLVLLEALAQGLPVVSTAYMGARDILLPQQGAVIASEDVDDFSGKVLDLLDDNERREKLAKQAVEYAGTWTSNEMAKKMKDYYQHVISYELPGKPEHEQVNRQSGIPQAAQVND